MVKNQIMRDMLRTERVNHLKIFLLKEQERMVHLEKQKERVVFQ